MSRSQQDYVDDSSDNYRRTLKTLLGRLDKAQKKQLQQSASALLRLDQEWLAQRRQRVERIVELLAGREENWQGQLLQQLFVGNVDSEDKHYLQMREQNQRLVLTTVVEMVNQRSVKQDRHLHKVLKKWQRRLKALLPDVSEDAAPAVASASL